MRAVDNYLDEIDVLLEATLIRIFELCYTEENFQLAKAIVMQLAEGVYGSFERLINGVADEYARNN